VSVDLPKALVQRHLANLSEVLASAVAVPHFVDAAGGRRMDGFQITQVKPGGIAEQVGLRDGDVVVDVDGQPLDSMAAAMLLVARAPSLTNARLSVSRGGTIVNFVVSVK
jgi:general secretion pathway protein C